MALLKIDRAMAYFSVRSLTRLLALTTRLRKLKNPGAVVPSV